jgi:hypothetical protein
LTCDCVIDKHEETLLQTLTINFWSHSFLTVIGEALQRLLTISRTSSNTSIIPSGASSEVEADGECEINCGSPFLSTLGSATISNCKKPINALLG